MPSEWGKLRDSSFEETALGENHFLNDAQVSQLRANRFESSIFDTHDSNIVRFVDRFWEAKQYQMAGACALRVGLFAMVMLCPSPLSAGVGIPTK